MRQVLDGPFIRFAVVGIANTLCGLAIIYAAKFFAGYDDIAANVVGYGTGILISFTFNRRWTFAYKGPTGTAFGRFVLVLAVAFGLNLVTVLGALRIGINAYIAQAIGIFPYTAFAYFASKKFAFSAAKT